MRVCVHPTLRAPGEARRALEPLAERIGPSTLTDLTVVVSELVAASVAHGATNPIDISLTISDHQIEGVFYDRGPAARGMARARRAADSPLVVAIVDGLVDDWGINGPQTRIWFRLSMRASAQVEQGAAR